MILNTNSKKSLEIQLDISDYEKVKRCKWFNKLEQKRVRIYTIIDGKSISLSKFLFVVRNNQVVIHKNNNSLDFRRKNIQILTRHEYGHLYGNKNKISTSMYNGVYYCSTTKKWCVRQIQGRKILKEHCYEEEYEAAIVSDYHAILHYKDNANLNFPEMKFEELEKSYKLIRLKYGITSSEIKSRSNQGISKAKNKTSMYVGVTYDKRRIKWEAKTKYLGKKIWIGYFESEIEAAKAYDNKVIEIYGENAKTNF